MADRSLLQRIRERFVAPAPRSKQIGSSGTVNTRGFIEDREFNRLLLWPQNLDEYEAMRRTDPTCRWMLALVSTPIRAAVWDVEPASDEPEDLEVAAFVREALFCQLDGGWDEFLRQALTYLDFGHSVFERVAELREIEFDYDIETVEIVQPPAPTAPAPALGPPETSNGAAADAGGDGPSPPVAPAPPSPVNGQPPPIGIPPKPKPVRKTETKTVSREAFVLARLAPRLQRTIWEWVPKPDDESKLDSITQQLASGSGRVSVPADRLVVFVHEKEGDDWRGVSILRSAWKAYYHKLQLENLEAIAYERSAGLPLVYPPSDADSSQLDSVESAISAIRQGENLWLMMPGPKAGTVDGVEGWTVEDFVVRGDGETSADAAIQRCQSDMARNVMAEFMRLGHENVGARATADVQQDPYYQAVEAHARYIEEVVDESIIRPLVDWNYDVTRYPTIRASKIQARNVQVVSEAVAKLLGANALSADSELERWVRELIDAPPPSEDEQLAELEAEPPEPTGPPPQPDPANPQPSGDPPMPQGASPGAKEDGPTTTATEPNGRDRRLRDLRELIGGGTTFALPREPVGVERFVAWNQIQQTLDQGALDVVSIGEEVMSAQIDSALELAQRAVDQNDPALLDQIALDSAPLADRLEQELTRIHQTGAADVRAEIRRETANEPVDQNATAASLAVPKIPLSTGDLARAIAATAKTLAEDAASAAVRAIRNRAVKSITQRAETALAPGEDPRAALRAALSRGATPAVNRIYTLGRMDELRAQGRSGKVELVSYSALLDANTCPSCADWDGTVVALDQAIDLPNPECDGGDRCRCQWIPYGLGAPSESGVPATPQFEQPRDEAILELAGAVRDQTAALSAAPAPVVNVTTPPVEVEVKMPESAPPEITLEQPEPLRRKRRRGKIRRDADGNMTEIEIEETD